MHIHIHIYIYIYTNCYSTDYSQRIILIIDWGRRSSLAVIYGGICIYVYMYIRMYAHIHTYKYT